MPLYRLHKICLALFLMVFCTSLAFAASDQTDNKQRDTVAQQVLPTISTPTVALLNITSEYTKECLTDFKEKTKIPMYADPLLEGPTDLLKKDSREQSTFTMFDGGDIRCSVAPLSNKFSLNPIADIMNLEVLLQHKF